MSPELGQFSLVLALVVAGVMSYTGLVGAWRHNGRLLAMVRPSAIALFVTVAIAFASLTWAFVTTNLTVSYVAHNSNAAIPLIYKISGVWGAHSGSMLLWILMISVWTLAVAVFSRRLPIRFSARVLGVMGLVALSFLIYSVWLTNPFIRALPPASRGADLNPILQSPFLAVHPPLLYMGYVGLSVAFAFSAAALIGGRMDTAWARWTRPWVLAAWVFLTIGITLGSFWAYFELGWGGWWFWDPVENASFMPWLAATALIHSLSVTEKRGAFKSWTALLALLGFSLSLLGTFLVRSGVLISVHAFAIDPRRGIYVLAILAAAVTAGLMLYTWRAPKLIGGGGFSLFSRETAILTMNAILVVACAAVLLGTLFPLFYSVAGLGRISVGPPYFDKVFIPLMVPLFMLIGLGPAIRWRRGSVRELWSRVRWPLALAIVVGVVLAALSWGGIPPVALAGLTMGAWVLISAVYELVRRLLRSPVGQRLRFSRGTWGMSMAHFGAGLLILGVALSTTMSSYLDVSLKPGQHATVGNYQFYFVSEHRVHGPNYHGEQATFKIFHHGQFISTVRPEARIYKGGAPATKSAISWTPVRDLYVAIGHPTGGGAWSTRLQVRPFVRFIWFGGAVIALGGLLALTDPRYRKRREVSITEGATEGAG